MKIFILGAGHMGAWLYKELSQKHEVSIYDRDFKQSAAIKEARIIDSLADLKKIDPEMLINAVSIQNTIEAFESAVPYISESCIISDVASVKGKIPEYYKKCSFPFASIHPMFGPTFANVASLKDENVIIIKESDPEGAAFFRKFFQNLGPNLFEYTFEEHDLIIAYSLTFPFASSLVFAACMNTSTVPGTTFKKHLQIARGLLSEDDYLLAEILFNPHSLPQLEKVTSRLEFLKHVIKQKDMDEAKRFFHRLRENIQ